MDVHFEWVRPTNAQGRLMKFITVLSCVWFLSGCAGGYLDLYGQDGEKVGECTAGFDWHPIGVTHSVDWVLNYCYELAISEGDIVKSVSDSSVIEKDYTYPAHSSGMPWDKKLAWSAFWSNEIDEVLYGYIVADLENEYHLKITQAEEQLLASKISESQYEAIIKRAKYAFHGK
jgi:hypothetical protein